MSNLKLISILLIFIISFLGFQNLHAQGRGNKGPHKKQCLMVMKRTHFVIVEARKAIKLNKNYTGKFAKARLHQKVARRKFTAGQFLRAIHHSRYARLLAFKVIQENKGTIPQGYDFNPEELQVIGTNPQDAELEKEAQTELPNEPKTDEDALKGQEKDTDVVDLEKK